MKRFAPVVVAVALAFAAAGSAGAALKGSTLCVGKGTTCFPTLAAALAAAHNGDTVQLRAGVYTGGVTIDASINLVGAGAGRTIIKGGGPVMTIGVDGDPSNDQLEVSISGVTVTGGVTTTAQTPDGPITFVAAGGGIDIPGDGGSGTVGATVTIRDSAITGNRATPSSTTGSGDPSCPGGDCPFAQGVGGGIVDVGKLTLTHTLVSGNVAGGPLASDADGGGIWTATNGGPGALTLIDSTVTNNRASVSAPNGRFAEGGGIEVQDGEMFLVQNSTVSNDTASVSNNFPTGVDMGAISGGIHIGGFGSATIDDSLITGNTASVDDPSGFPFAFDAGLSDGFSDCPCGQTLVLQNTLISHNHTIANVASSDNNPSDSALEIDGQATVNNTTISDNTTTVTSHHGSASSLGAVVTFDFDTGSIVMTDSTIANNTVTVSTHTGPATIQGAGLTNLAALELHNVTITGNSAHATGQAGSLAQGGGIWNGQLGDPTPQLTLQNTEVTNNVLTGGRGVTLQGGGLFTVGFPVTLDNSNISHNTPDDCAGC